MQRTDPDQAGATQLQGGVVRERQLSSARATGSQRHASTEFDPIAGRPPVIIRGPLNLDLVGDDRQCGSPGGWNAKPNIGAAQCNHEERHESYHTHNRPRVHEESSEAIPSRYCLNLVVCK